jgi:3D-(3,5/4)-trihydroxycyclohexane-1,2-dione acylhydrolase (decyclizing)
MMAPDSPIDDRIPTAEKTVHLTVAQAVVRFLGNQHVERDGETTQFFAGSFGIFGHGNVAGLGQALLQQELTDLEAGVEPLLPYVLGRNEQAMVHSAVAYSRMRNRMQAWAVTASVGPGSTNMVTGAALATINRLPVLLLAADTFATRASAPVLQELELPSVPAGQSILRPCMAAGATRRCAAGRNARADRSGRNRRGHPGHSPRRAGRSL